VLATLASAERPRFFHSHRETGQGDSGTSFLIRAPARRIAANGDGISFQICHDVVVENCNCHDNSNLGLHPGSGSQRPVIRGNRLERNDLGLFWCWGVKFGLAENNKIDANRRYGISIGHNDTDKGDWISRIIQGN
jgi:hypothetical protein